MKYKWILTASNTRNGDYLCYYCETPDGEAQMNYSSYSKAKRFDSFQKARAMRHKMREMYPNLYYWRAERINV